MKHINTVLPTVGGENTQPVSASQAGRQAAGAGPARDHVDVINQVFAELELAYHNQFHKAYAQSGALSLAKKYWLNVLQEFPSAVILSAVRAVVRNSEFMPSLAAMVSACEKAYELFGLPDVQAAYVEACCAPEPKHLYRWSHPAVFHAAQQTGWYELASETKAQVLPVFSYNYELLCQRVIRGEELSVPINKALPEQSAVTLSKEENRKKLKALREKFSL